MHDGLLLVRKPTDPLCGDAPCIALVVPAVCSLLLRANERVKSVLDSLTRTGHRLLSLRFEYSEAPFSLIFIESLWPRGDDARMYC